MTDNYRRTEENTMTKNELVTFHWSSNVFHVPQPDGYAFVSDSLWDLEQEQNTEYAERLNERVFICDPKQRMFREEFGNKPAGRRMKRRDLPVNHPKYLEAGIYELNTDAYLENLCRAWVTAFQSYIQERSRSKTVPPIALEYTGVSSPRYYNYETDAALFTLTLPQSELDRIVKQCLQYEEAFEYHLNEVCGSYDGFTALPPTSIKDWKAVWREGEQDGGYDRAAWRLLEFWLFAFSPTSPDKPPSEKQRGENVQEFRDVFGELSYEIDYDWVLQPEEEAQACA
jgi:hypothetical protein